MVLADILVAEDDSEHAEIVQTLLERRGYRVHVVHSGLEAIAHAIHTRPALIVLDFYMPEVDGLTVAARLREDERTRRVPIVLTTASPDDRVREAREELGLVLLEKPFRTADLVWAVEVALAGASTPAVARA
jgi:CheY-like chemotaxis protein